jgi:hypothetical protein
MPSGNPDLAGLSRINARLDAHEARLDEHDHQLREINLDVALLGDIVMRSRARAASVKVRRRRSRRG